MKIPYSAAMTMGDTLTASRALEKAMKPTLATTVMTMVTPVTLKYATRIGKMVISGMTPSEIWGAVKTIFLMDVAKVVGPIKTNVTPSSTVVDPMS